MTEDEFSSKIRQLGQQLHGSVTSWGRTVKHSIEVGGFDGDPHTWWLGADMIYDSGPNEPLADGMAHALGLRVLHEKGHDHYQPLDWVNQPHSKLA